jgi:putative Mg2+ transporter-C (MgtC) family protein
MMSFLSIGSEGILFVQIFLATVLGMILGIERLIAGRAAGPRTYGLISLGSCLATIVSLRIAPMYLAAGVPAGTLSLNPVMIVANILVGIGFIGAGMIVLHGSQVSGLTTAAGIWVAAIIGIAVAFGFYGLATFSTFLTLFLFSTFWHWEHRLKDKEKEELEKPA